MGMKFTEVGFNIETTQDGSPTLRLLNGTPENGETMHHSGGAYSETVYIYGKALEFGFSKVKDPKILSVGLGLGYVETLAAAYALKFGSNDWELDSYEKVEGLRQNFQEFYLGSATHLVYEEILVRTSKTFELDPLKLKEAVKLALQSGRLRLKADLLEDELPKGFYQVICYDAFSSKTNPDLWTEEFLGKVLSSADSKTCGFSTYACMGNLKRSLRRDQFEMEVRDGFYGKRNCTWASRSSLF